MRRTIAALAAAAAAAGLVASAMGAQAATKGVVISTRSVPKLGTVLVNAKGRTLYMFVPDKRRRVTCIGACASLWPPVKLPHGARALARGKVQAKLLGNDRDPTGGRVVTYARWPLYTYVADTKPGEATGQALKLNGGYWYALSPAGTVIKKKP